MTSKVTHFIKFCTAQGAFRPSAQLWRLYHRDSSGREFVYPDMHSENLEGLVKQLNPSIHGVLSLSPVTIAHQPSEK